MKKPDSFELGFFVFRYPTFPVICTSPLEKGGLRGIWFCAAIGDDLS